MDSGIQHKTRSYLLWPILGAFILAAIVIFGRIAWINRSLVTAERAFQQENWEQARQSYSLYLRSYPNHSRARLSMAESLIRDDNLMGKEKVHEAIQHLSFIPDQTPLAADARILEGRLDLLMLLQPARAEIALQRSLRESPLRQEAHSLLWKLYDLTDRWDLAEEHVWKIYEQTPSSYRTSVLRDWYLSEFCSSAANFELDQFLGFLKKGDQFNVETDRTRLQAFIDADPQWPRGYAILARWYLRKRDHASAATLLEQSEKLPGAAQDSMSIAVRVALNVELGKLDQIQEISSNWPEPKEGYDYWKTAGLVADEFRRNDQSACQAYEKALLTTPGRSDWRTMHRLSQCQKRLGETEKSVATQQKSREISALMAPQLHRRLRQNLIKLHDPKTVAEMVDFYEKLGRKREAAAWQHGAP